MRLENLDSVSAALAKIESVMGAEPLPVHKTQPKARESDSGLQLELSSIGPVTSKSLVNYLARRGLSLNDASKFLREAHYRRGDAAYFSLAFANDSGGYELRNPVFKGTLGKKDISTIAGDPDCVAIFEGSLDFVSYAARNGRVVETTIVLNSLGLRDPAMHAIRNLGSTRVDIYADNDEPGRNLVALLSRRCRRLKSSINQ